MPLQGEQRSFGDRLADALGGFGAGYRGQGQEYTQGLEKQRQMALVQDAHTARQFLLNNDIDSAANLLVDRVNNIESLGGDPSDTIQLLSKVQSGDIAGSIADLSIPIEYAASQGLFELPTAKKGLASAKTEILADGTTIQALPDGTTQVIDPSGKVVSGKERGDALNRAYEFELSLASGKERAKVEGKAEGEANTANIVAKTKTFINTQVKLAEKAAGERGEVITELSRMQAALPGLTDVVGKLRELAPIATSTLGGRVWDTAVKELGFGSTKGATASAKFGAMVNNQVLPLLKPTFGAAFTVQEGDALRATMGDKNASVQEKMAVLDAFIEQKQRDIEAKQRQLNQVPSPSPAGQTDLTQMSLEDLMKLRAQAQ